MRGTQVSEMGPCASQAPGWGRRGHRRPPPPSPAPATGRVDRSTPATPPGALSRGLLPAGPCLHCLTCGPCWAVRGRWPGCCARLQGWCPGRERLTTWVLPSFLPGHLTVVNVVCSFNHCSQCCLSQQVVSVFLLVIMMQLSVLSTVVICVLSPCNTTGRWRERAREPAHRTSYGC